MELIVGLGILCVIVLLGFAALILLKNTQDRELLKDLLDARVDIARAKKSSDQTNETCSLMAHNVREDMKKILEKLELVRADASEAKLSGQSILKEYEINGVPLGYKRGDHYDAIDGV